MLLSFKQRDSIMYKVSLLDFGVRIVKGYEKWLFVQLSEDCIREYRGTLDNCLLVKEMSFAEFDRYFNETFPIDQCELVVLT